MRYYCMTHKELPEYVRPYMTGISNRSGLGPHVRNVAAGIEHLEGGGDRLSEYATLFGLARELATETDDLDEMIAFSHYRKFPAVQEVQGNQTDVYSAITPAEFADLGDDVLVPPDGVLVFPEPTRHGMNLISQYDYCHVLRDFLYFMALAIDLGVVEDSDVARYLDGELMLCAPTVGVFPKSWVVQAMHALETVAVAFESTVNIPREGYQKRVLGFCIERLHSLLLMQLVAAWPAGMTRAHRIILVSEDRGYQVGA